MYNLLYNLLKNTIFALAKGKMQEWLNWPAWKASKPQKGFGGSNPPLSAKQNKQEDTERDLLAYFLTIDYICSPAISGAVPASCPLNGNAPGV